MCAHAIKKFSFMLQQSIPKTPCLRVSVVRFGLPVRYNKNPAEWEQNFSLIVRRIRFLKAFQAHLFEELALLVVGQAVEIRAHAGAADPVKNGLRTVH